MSVPAGVLPDLVVIQPGLAFGGLEGFFDGGAGSGDSDQFGQAGAGRCVAQVVGQVGGIGNAAAGQQPIVGVGEVDAVDGCSGPVVESVPFDSLTR